ncbi:DUF2510 domain-containing protein [Curtobacterium sp. 9128]|uniref:DUF2510 domain-containing protein n=1 Tax=Curtobacterium sp. 9128 TaxID=1793722 RepID=UPI00119FF119|nr:DUF2510 domain-containing protein [Curtobacterium sp. 9128]
MTLPAAGWFPDPRDAGRLRWWDGHAWGAATRPLPDGRPGPVLPVVVAPTGPAFSVRAGPVDHRAWAYGAGTSRRLSVVAIVAVVLAVASPVWNPLGALSVLATVVGIVALVRPGVTGRWRVLARSLACSALVLAVATGIVAALALADHLGSLAR